MQLLEWAFAEDVQTAEKLVLVYLAANANPVGVGLVDRDALAEATGYRPRSIQRLLKALRDRQVLIDLGAWYRVGPLAFNIKGPNAKLLAVQIGELPEDMQPLPPGEQRPAMTMQEITDAEGGTMDYLDTDAFATDVAEAAADMVTDQLNNFEHRMGQRLDRLAAIRHVEQLSREAEPPQPPDPVLENPLYQQLVDSGMDADRAYTLSEADLAIDDDLDQAEPMAVTGANGADYEDNAGGRFERVLDILHGINASLHDKVTSRRTWTELEAQENKFTQKGETAAFELLYPAIIAAAKANVGQIDIEQFIDPKRAGIGQAAWDVELDPIDKNDPALQAEISVMLAELEGAADPRCNVQPRTKETGDDGVVREETLLAFHRRVGAKHREMIKLQRMGII